MDSKREELMTSKTALWIRTTLFLLLAFPLVLMAYRGLPVGLGSWSGIAGPLIAALSALVLFLGTKWLLRSEGSHLGEFGLTPPTFVLRHLTAGFLAGGLLLAILAVLIRSFLPMHWILSNSVSWMSVLVALAHHVITNTCEELAFRGYGFSRLCRLIGMWPAQAVVAGISACFHVICGWSWKVALVHTTAGSLLFALVFLRWRSIPAAIGVHAAWNWTRDLVLSMPAVPASILVPVQEKPWGDSEWLLVQSILVGGTLVACLGLIVSLQKSKRS